VAGGVVRGGVSAETVAGLVSGGVVTETVAGGGVLCHRWGAEHSHHQHCGDCCENYFTAAHNLLSPSYKVWRGVIIQHLLNVLYFPQVEYSRKLRASGIKYAAKSELLDPLVEVALRINRSFAAV
jgi:hypothetical protein